MGLQYQSNMEGKTDLSDVIFLLNICGIINTSKGIWGKIMSLIQLLRVLVIISGCIICNVSVYFSGIKEDDGPRLMIICTFSLITSIQVVYFWLHRHGIANTINSFKAAIQKRHEPKHKEYFKQFSSLGWFAISVLIYSFIGITFLYYAVPILYDIYLVIFTNSTEPFAMPVPYKGVLGTDHPTRSLQYYSLIIYIMLSTNCAGFVTTGYFALLYLLIFYICSEVKIISEKTIDWGNLYSVVGNTSETITALKDIIQDHQETLGLAKGLREALGFPCLVYSIIGPMFITFHLFTLSTVSSENEMDRTSVLSMSVSLITWVTAMFLCCLMGEILQSQSLKIYETLCEIPWYETSPKTMKNLGLIMLQAVKPMAIHYKGHGHVSLQLYQEMMNAAYSFFMLLNSMK